VYQRLSIGRGSSRSRDDLRSLLNPRFIAPVDLQPLRLMGRYRMKLKGVVAGEKNRLHKVLDDAGIRLGGVVSDIQGTSAQAMMAGRVAGQPVASLLTQACGCQRARTPSGIWKSRFIMWMTTCWREWNRTAQRGNCYKRFPELTFN
jgi:hypothetical protein